MTDRLPCPRHPTDGRMRTILEHHGIRARGRDITEARMIQMLNELGYDVLTGPAPGGDSGSR